MKMFSYIFLIAVLFLFSCGGEVGKTYRYANRLARSGEPEKWDEAIKEYQKIVDYQVSARDKQVQLYRKLADRYFANEAWNDAIYNYEKAIEIYPGQAYLYCQLGTTYGQLLKSSVSSVESGSIIEKASENYQKAIKIDPHFIRAHYGFGILKFYHLGMKKEAIAHMNKILDIEKENTEALFALGRFYYEMGDLPGSMEYYQKLSGILPKNSPRLKKCVENISRIRNELHKGINQGIMVQEEDISE